MQAVSPAAPACLPELRSSAYTEIKPGGGTVISTVNSSEVLFKLIVCSSGTRCVFGSAKVLRLRTWPSLIDFETTESLGAICTA